ncbi:MAG: pirin family protein [Ferruginibacter sp.]
MKLTIRPAAKRGTADHGWLKASYSFSFANYHNPSNIHFGALRVLNDDIVAGAGGFPTHPHDNMEIVTIPLRGALQHKDSTGGQGIIKSGDVQIMSAGTGVQHSEANASATEDVNLLQVWVFPKEKNIKPSYDQRSFDVAARKNKWQTVVSPLEADQALWINQDAAFSLSQIDAGAAVEYHNKFPGNLVYLFVIDGSITINDQTLNKRDALEISDTENFTVMAGTDASLLAIEIPQ